MVNVAACNFCRSEDIGDRRGRRALSLSEGVGARFQIRLFLGGVVAGQEMVAMGESSELTDECAMLFG
jgi:hypothetical protein